MKKSQIIGITILFLLTCIHLSYNQGLNLDGYAGNVNEKCALNNSECLTIQAQKILELFSIGIPELGIESIKELAIESIKVDVPNLGFEWNDVRVRGLENATIDSVSINTDFKLMRILFHTNLVVDVSYILAGAFFSVVESFGNGKGNITINEIQIEIIIVFDVVQDIIGNNYIDLQTYQFGVVVPDGVQYYGDNLYNGDETRSAILLDILDQNWRTLVTMFHGYFNINLTDKIFEIIKTYIRSIPIDSNLI